MKAFTKKIVLENGREFYGYGFGADREAINEIVFNTSMVGYQEIMSDPSYTDQMVVMTYPLIGNYGMADEDYETKTPTIGGMIVREYNDSPSNFRYTKTLNEVFEEHDIPAIWGVDTRALTRHLRINGAMRGVISTRDLDVESLRAKACALPSMEGQNLVPFVAARKPYILTADGPRDVQFDADGAYAWQGTGIPLLVYDFGVKWNILRLLAEAGFEPLAVPPSFTPDQARASGARGVFLSNGPGDPATLKDEIAIIRELVKEFPVTGICLGHQLIGHALGGTTAKLKFGHHGCNHPVKDLGTGRIEISSQNHGFHVVLDGLDDVEATHINLNDQTLEGLRHKTLPVMSVQYHPEAAAGPHDGRYLFERFHEMMKAALA